MVKTFKSRNEEQDCTGWHESPQSYYCDKRGEDWEHGTIQQFTILQNPTCPVCNAVMTYGNFFV